MKKLTDLRNIAFWKNLLRVFLLFQAVKISFISVISFIEGGGSNVSFLDSMLSLIFFPIDLIAAFLCSLVVVFSVSGRLEGENPKSVFKIGLVKLFAALFLLPLPLMLFILALDLSSDGDMSIFFYLTFWIVNEIAIFSWIYLSTLWLYKTNKKSLDFINTKKRVRAIIVEDGRLLAIKRIKENETHWVLPGGGVENGESLETALKRECIEELGVEVEVGEFVLEDDFYWNDILEKVYFYKCKILSGEIGTGEGPEFQEDSPYEGSHEVEWLDLGKIEEYDLRPEKIKEIMKK